MIDLIARIVKVLNSETEPSQISLAVCFAMIIGFTPLMSLHNVIILLLVCVLRVNLSAFIVTWGIFSGLAYLLDPLFHKIGLSVLSAKSLQPLWTSFYNTIWLRLGNFNNTVVMGSLIFSLVLFVPVLLGLNFSIRTYRSRVLDWLKKTRIAQALSASRFYHIYQTVSGWGGRS
ncbi:MAG: TIGR03546 family protein [Deltaproteobacteria bacterium]|jgi:uncharacterized protein (TIGR03546 family)